MYAVYTILLKFFIEDESKMDMFLFFGFLGLWIMLLIWPFEIILQYIPFLDHEPFTEFPPVEVLVSLIITGIVLALFNLIMGVATLFTSPLLSNVGFSLVVPLAIVSDALIHQKSFDVLYIVGTLLVFFGFLFMVN